MTDDLVKRLREDQPVTQDWASTMECGLMDEAADRIEALTAKVAELEACLERQGSGHREDLDEIANVSVERLRRAEAAEAERDRLREAARFKPLVWFEAELPSRGGGKITAEGYTIRRIEGLWLLDFAGESKSVWLWADLQAAKAAAQADYEARILSALETEAQPDAEKLQ